MRLALALAAAAASLACAHGPSAAERKSAEIHHDLGVEALRGGRMPDAIREFDAALAIDDRFAEAHRGRALVLDFGFGRTDDAEKAYRRAIALRPDFSEARNDLGQLLARTGRYDAAIAEFDAALDNMLYKEPYVARCNKGEALYQLGKRSEGIAELKSCIAAAPRYCRGHRELGRINAPVPFDQVQADSITGLVSIIVACVLYVGLCWTIMRTCYGLVHDVPSTILRWVGGAHSTHDKGAEFGGAYTGQANQGLARAEPLLARAPTALGRAAGGGDKGPSPRTKTTGGSIGPSDGGNS